MDLLDLKPRKSSFVIKIKGREKRLFLRPFVLRDEAWLQENWDQHDLTMKVVQGDVDTICRIVWHMMSVKSKEFVINIKATFKDVDDDGNKITINPKGYKKLMALLGETGISAPLTAFYETRGLNDSVIAIPNNTCVVYNISHEIFTRHSRLSN